jgi:integrase
MTEKKAGPKRRHEGITKLEDGRFLIRVRARDSRTGRYREKERTLELGATISEAVTVREEMRKQIIAGGAAHGGRLRLEDAAVSWMHSKLPTWRKSVRDHNADLLDKQVLPTLGRYYLDAITQQDIVQWRDSQALLRKGEGENATPISPVTVNSRLRLLKQVLADLTAERGLPNPAARVPALRVPKARRRKGLEPEQAAAMLTKLREESPRWFPIAAVAVLTGQRWGAVSALEWEQIDYTRGVIRFDRAHVRGVLDDQKTSADVEVPLVPVLREILDEQRRDLRMREKRRGERREPGTVVLESATGLEGRWVFPSKHGTLMQPSSLRAPLRAACEAAGVPVISPHGLRYTFNHASLRVTTAEVTRAIMGHSTPEMTRHYDWIRNEEKAAALTQITSLISPSAAGGTSGGSCPPGTATGG